MIWAGWRTLFVILSVFGVACLALSLAFYRETHLPENRTKLNVISTIRELPA